MADEDCWQELVVQMLLELLARRAPHDVVADLTALGRLLCFLIFFIHIKIEHKHKHEKKGSYQENREISRRVAWIAEQRRHEFEALVNKRYKVDQHPKDPEATA